MRVRRGLQSSLGAVMLVGYVLLSLSGCGEETDAPPAAVTTTAAPTPVPPPTATSTLTPTATDEPTPTLTPRATSTVRPTATATLTPTPRPRPTAPSPAALATQYPDLAPLLNNPEVDGAYKELAVAYAQGGQQGALAAAQQRGLVTPEGDIRVDLVLDAPATEETLTRLQSMGIKVLATQDNRVQIAVPQALLMTGTSQPGAALNQLSGIEHVTALLPPQ